MPEMPAWSTLSDSDQQAVRRAMEYWVRHWDWECPTLFGLELDELIRTVETWPRVAAGSEETTCLAAVGAVRELFGGSAPPRAELTELIGLSYEQASELAAAVHAIAEISADSVRSD